VDKPEGKKPLRRSKRKRKDNIKILNKQGEDTERMNLVQTGISGWLL
jgi:hypothetical protein